MPEWRNWQTQQTQNLPLATTCRFDPGLRHHRKLCRCGTDFPKSERETLRDFLTILSFSRADDPLLFCGVDSIAGSAYIIRQ